MRSNVETIFIIIAFCLSSAVLAQVEFQDHAVPELISSTNNMAMGNANFGEDFGPLSVFTNPASRLSSRKHKFGLFNFNGAFSTDTFSETFGSRGLSFGSFQRGTDFLSQKTMKDALTESDGGILYQRMNVASYYQYKRFTIGHFSSHFSNGSQVDETSTFFGNRREDHGPYINYTSLLSRKILFGMTYVYLTRSETQGMIQTGGATDVKTFGGKTNHLILALKYRLTRKFIASVVTRDALNSNYFDRASSGTPRNDKQTFDVAFTAFMFRNKLKANMAFRDITAQTPGDVDSIRKIQLGFEYSRLSVWGFRFGMLDGGPTLGAFINTRKVGKYSFSLYSVDTSITGVRDQDRRLSFQYSL
jgi:hypothetical protein